MEALGSSSIIAGGITVPTGTGPNVAIDSSTKPLRSLARICWKRSLKLQVVAPPTCWPMGPTYTITSAEGNIVLELDSRPAMKVLENYLSSAESKAEQNAISFGLKCGIQPKHSDNEDYLIRQARICTHARGIALAWTIQVGDKIRFHVRDKAAAEKDLALMVKRAKMKRTFTKPKGIPLAALQISYVARGRNFFGIPNVDLSHTKGLLDGGGPVAGFFADGEIEPAGIAGITRDQATGGGTYLHGITTVIALLYDMSSASSEDDPLPRVSVGMLVCGAKCFDERHSNANFDSRNLLFPQDVVVYSSSYLKFLCCEAILRCCTTL